MDAELRRYRVDLHSLAIGFPEPAPAHRFEKEYYEDFGSEVPFRKFGYMSLAAFLDDHPDLQQVILYGQKTYRAKISAATADIQSLVSRQKSNKKGKNGKQRFRAPVMKLQPRMLPPPPIRPMKPQNAVQKTVQPVKEEPLTGSPAERAHRGMQRILEALNRCCGMATLTKLNAAYQLLYGTQMNRKEMIAHFGTVNFRTIHETWLSNEGSMGYHDKVFFRGSERGTARGGRGGHRGGGDRGSQRGGRGPTRINHLHYNNSRPVIGSVPLRLLAEAQNIVATAFTSEDARSALRMQRSIVEMYIANRDSADGDSQEAHPDQEMEEEAVEEPLSYEEQLRLILADNRQATRPLEDRLRSLMGTQHHVAQQPKKKEVKDKKDQKDTKRGREKTREKHKKKKVRRDRTPSSSSSSSSSSSDSSARRRSSSSDSSRSPSPPPAKTNSKPPEAYKNQKGTSCAGTPGCSTAVPPPETPRSSKPKKEGKKTMKNTEHAPTVDVVGKIQGEMDAGSNPKN